MSILRIILLLFRALFQDRVQLALENLALRQQLAILHRKSPRPRLRRADRDFWLSLARVWEQWRSALILVKPETVLRWHRLGFRYFWRWRWPSTWPGGADGFPLKPGAPFFGITFAPRQPATSSWFPRPPSTCSSVS